MGNDLAAPPDGFDKLTKTLATAPNRNTVNRLVGLANAAGEPVAGRVDPGPSCRRPQT